MTREGDVITIDGYTNSELDHKHLALRGEYASGCDLFISLHTNANLDNANGYSTLDQPINLTKTDIIVNRLASESNNTLQQAAAVGRGVTQVNYDLGLSVTEAFNEFPVERSDAYNDSLDTPGSICYRWQESGEDYYGVLRGASSVGVPGFIVEHGHHTVSAVRDAAQNNDLSTKWAEADAAGIAYGYGFSAY